VSLEKRKMDWVKLCNEHRLILSALAGDMTQKTANKLVKQTCDRINEDKLTIISLQMGENTIKKHY